MWTSQLSEMFIGKYEYMIVFSVFLGIQRFVQRQYLTGLGVEQTIFSVVFSVILINLLLENLLVAQ